MLHTHLRQVCEQCSALVRHGALMTGSVCRPPHHASWGRRQNDEPFWSDTTMKRNFIDPQSKWAWSEWAQRYPARCQRDLRIHRYEP